RHVSRSHYRAPERAEHAALPGLVGRRLTPVTPPLELAGHIVSARPGGHVTTASTTGRHAALEPDQHAFGGRPSGPQRPDFEAIQDSPEFAELRHRLRRFIFPMTGLF